VQLDADDAGFVRAPVELVYRRLTDVADWPSWWPGLRVRSAPPVGGDEVWLLDVPAGRLRQVRLAARCHGWRFNAGFHLALHGDIDGRGEFWLEPVAGGTVVHHVLSGTTTLPHPRRVLADHRRAVRRGLWGLKDALQLETRTSAGLLP
jgi:uncharacterized protein YndB with AHSA1/START domain